MNPEKKWLFIVNPIAGNGYASECVEIIKSHINEKKLNAEIVFTERQKHATELAHFYASQGVQNIIAVGGDGTINEIAQALVERNDIVLGMVPAGTGNDFIQILGFPERFTAADWEVFLAENVIRMDVGKCNDHFFLNGMGLGFDAQVAAENYNPGLEVKKGGASKYLWQILKTLFFYREKNMHQLANGQSQELTCFMNTISIGRRFAGGYYLTPNALANDGLLDVCAVAALKLFERFGLFLKVPTGQHIKSRKVNYYQIKELHLGFDEVVPYHLDGELFFDSSFEVKIVPAALSIIYNPGGPHFFKK
jgi:YegS/Rv2252/BmrU family lipid kinase